MLNMYMYTTAVFRGLKGLGILAGTEYPGDRPARRETFTLVTETAGKATARRETSTSMTAGSETSQVGTGHVRLQDAGSETWT